MEKIMFWAVKMEIINFNCRQKTKFFVPFLLIHNRVLLIKKASYLDHYIVLSNNLFYPKDRYYQHLPGTFCIFKQI